MVEAIFWIAFASIAYVYLGYPLVLLVWRAIAPRPVRKQYWEPRVSIVIAMHNEVENVRAKIQNCFDLDYPKDKLQVVLALDAPTDGTDALAQEYAGKGVDVVHCPVRRGKAATLNSGVALAKGEILMFADAEQRLERDALRELVANFADDSVGAVSGALVLLDARDREATDGVGLYWRYEKALRSLESRIHSVPGATGAIYAVRRELFRPLTPGTILDDVVTPMRIVMAGKRAIFEPAARAYDAVTQSPESEYEKKKRTLSGNYQLLSEMPELLLPWRNPIFAQMVSHKLGRLVVPYWLAILFLSNLFLAGTFYRMILVMQVLWYAMACLGWWLMHRGESRRAALRTVEE